MKPLATNRRVLMRLGLYPFNGNTSKRSKINSIFNGMFIFGVAVSACVSCVIFIIKHVTTNLEDSLYALGQILIYSNALYMMVFVYLQRYKIVAIIENLAEIHVQCKTDSMLFSI